MGRTVATTGLGAFWAVSRLGDRARLSLKLSPSRRPECSRGWFASFLNAPDIVADAGARVFSLLDDGQRHHLPSSAGVLSGKARSAARDHEPTRSKAAIRSSAVVQCLARIRSLEISATPRSGRFARGRCRPSQTPRASSSTARYHGVPPTRSEVEPLDEVEATSTSARTADCTPIVLRATERVRLVFRPMLLVNDDQPHACIKGDFIYEKRPAGSAWMPANTLSLATVKSGEQYKLELHSGELLVPSQGARTRARRVPVSGGGRQRVRGAWQPGKARIV